MNYPLFVSTSFSLYKDLWRHVIIIKRASWYCHWDFSSLQCNIVMGLARHVSQMQIKVHVHGLFILQFVSKYFPILPKKKPGKHKNWMTDEIIHLLDERRKYKISGDANAYRRTDRLIKAKCNEAKEQFLNRKCEEMEDFYQLSPREAHQRIREVTGKYKSGGSKFSSIKSKTGEVLTETDDVLKRWEEYIKVLYTDGNRTDEPLVFDGELTGPEILESEVAAAVKSDKLGKAPGPDEISTEMLKYLGEDGVTSV